MTAANERKYRTIISDPPWDYRRCGVQGAAAGHYPTMTTEEICSLPVADLTSDNAVLFLWGTWPKFEEVNRVIKAWGFEVVTGFPWVKIVGLPSINLWGELQVKPQYGTGYWVRGCSEYVLICRRGTVKPPEGDWVGLLSENFGHSRKPENIYHIAEKLPGPYLEMFARRKREGWASWGNEVESDLAIAGPLEGDGSDTAAPLAL